MYNCHIFPNCEKVKKPFGPPKLDVVFMVSDMDLPEGSLDTADLNEYFWEHCEKDTIWKDSTTIDTILFKYPAYLASIKYLTDGGFILFNVYGISFYLGGWSFVCHDQAPVTLWEKVIVHELGHNMGDLRNACIKDSIWDYARHGSDSSCVMCQSLKELCICTGKNLITSIHFCDRCRDSLHFHWFGSAMGQPPNPSVLGERQRKAFDAWYDDQALSAERRKVK